MTQEVRCPYCSKLAILVGGKEIYPFRRDLFSLKFYLCRPCDAYVGCHKTGSGDQPLGRLANSELRRAKRNAHAAFDPLWQICGLSRAEAYEWLSTMLGKTSEETHIGMFDVIDCDRTVLFSNKYTKQLLGDSNGGQG